MNFLFLLDQKPKKVKKISDVIAQMKEISESTMAFADHFAPEKQRRGRNKFDDWITNEIKIAIKNLMIHFSDGEETQLN